MCAGRVLQRNARRQSYLFKKSLVSNGKIFFAKNQEVPEELESNEAGKERHGYEAWDVLRGNRHIRWGVRAWVPSNTNHEIWVGMAACIFLLALKKLFSANADSAFFRCWLRGFREFSSIIVPGVIEQNWQIFGQFLKINSEKNKNVKKTENDKKQKM